MMRVENFKIIVKFSLPLSVGVLFLWMQTQSYGIIIEKFIGAEFLGYFGVGIAVALAVSGAFEAIIVQYLYPIMYKRREPISNDYYQYFELSYPYLFFAGYLCIDICCLFYEHTSRCEIS